MMYQADGMWMYCFGWLVVWWLVASVFLYFAWNKVVASLAKLGLVTYWQALLIVATIAVFCGPSHMARRYGMTYAGRSSEQMKQERQEMMDDMIEGDRPGEVVLPEAP